MPLLIGALAALAVGAATLGSAAGAAVAFVCATAAASLFLPVVAPDFVDVWVLAMATLILGGGAAAWTRRRQDRGSRPRRAAILTLAAAPALLAVLAVASFVSTASLFRAGAYAALIGPVDTVAFSQAIQRLDTTGRLVASDRTVIDQETVRLVDAGVAERRAQELLGRDPEFGSTYRLGFMQLTRREGHLVFASPLEFTGLFRWRSSDGAPAYVWMDAHDARRAALVKEIGGEPVRLRCLGSAYFGSNLQRLVWASAPATATTDYAFEIGPGGPTVIAHPPHACSGGAAGRRGRRGGADGDRGGGRQHGLLAGLREARRRVQRLRPPRPADGAHPSRRQAARDRPGAGGRRADDHRRGQPDRPACGRPMSAGLIRRAAAGLAVVSSGRKGETDTEHQCCAGVKPGRTWRPRCDQHLR